MREGENVGQCVVLLKCLCVRFELSEACVSVSESERKIERVSEGERVPA